MTNKQCKPHEIKIHDSMRTGDVCHNGKEVIAVIAKSTKPYIFLTFLMSSNSKVVLTVAYIHLLSVIHCVLGLIQQESCTIRQTSDQFEVERDKKISPKCCDEEPWKVIATQSQNILFLLTAQYW